VLDATPWGSADLPVQSAAVSSGQQWPVGALADGGVDGPGGPWRERDQGRLVALPDDPDHAVTVGDREIGQVRRAGLRHPQRVEREQAGQDVVVAAPGQPCLDEERAELGPVESERVDSWETLGRRRWAAGECSRSCSSTQ
jgi:hypothetical protein